MPACLNPSAQQAITRLVRRTESGWVTNGFKSLAIQPFAASYVVRYQPKEASYRFDLGIDFPPPYTVYEECFSAEQVPGKMLCFGAFRRTAAEE